MNNFQVISWIIYPMLKNLFFDILKILMEKFRNLMSGKYLNVIKKIFRRFLLWLISFSVAFYIPFSQCGFPYDLDLWEKDIIHANKFEDFFLAVLAMVVLSGSNIFDCIILKSKKNIDIFSLGSSWLLIVSYFIFILYCMGAYGSLAGPPTAPYWSMHFTIVLCGLFGELIISFISE
ncbi:hypothetical protein B8X00_12945 [Acetobacter fabarum]|uniref:Uncharacterized protein n=2 Tax=Acetobacter fabarum TaxID=483199 RepID=A0A269XUG4_9PROT|nr:hypothetical protein B8X00_12945 [Acetobacter fabarum]